jgi:hypothetical protein
MGVFTTQFTGTITTTNQAFPHGMFTTPDFCTAENNVATATASINCTGWDATNVYLSCAVAGAGVRVNCQKFHSLIS